MGIDDNGSRTWTVYDDSSADAEPYADFNSSGGLTQRYLSGVGVVNGAVVDELLARTNSSGTTAWYLTDKLGSVRDIVSASGTELDHIVYDSFGNIVTETDSANGDRFKYAGMEYDATTGQYYDRARGYDPLTGRFSSLDPMGFGAGSSSLYSYVGNGATDATDPTGMSGIIESAGNMLHGIVQDAKTMLLHPIAAYEGWNQGQADGAAMVLNAATLGMTPLNNYVEGRIAMMGGGYQFANQAANFGVSILYAVAPCGWVANGIKLMSAASDAMTLGQGIAEMDAAKIAQGSIGILTLLVGRWCFVEGTLVHMAGEQEALRGNTVAAALDAAEKDAQYPGAWDKRALGLVCLAFGLGVYFLGRTDERRRSGLSSVSLVDAVLEKWPETDPPVSSQRRKSGKKRAPRAFEVS